MRGLPPKQSAHLVGILSREVFRQRMASEISQPFPYVCVRDPPSAPPPPEDHSEQKSRSYRGRQTFAVGKRNEASSSRANFQHTLWAGNDAATTASAALSARRTRPGGIVARERTAARSQTVTNAGYGDYRFVANHNGIAKDTFHARAGSGAGHPACAGFLPDHPQITTYSFIDHLDAGLMPEVSYSREHHR